MLNCIIVRNRLTELKYKNEKLRKDEFLQLSLKNTLIKSAKQYYLHDYLKSLNMPIILGVNNLSETGKWIDNRTIVKDLVYNNETILSNLIQELDIKQYGSFRGSFHSYKNNIETGFTYEK
jgi:hypothetical protein